MQEPGFNERISKFDIFLYAESSLGPSAIRQASTKVDHNSLEIVDSQRLLRLLYVELEMGDAIYFSLNLFFFSGLMNRFDN